MSDPSDLVLDELRRVARETLALEREIELSDTLHGTLGLDSLSALIVAVALEDRFRVKLQDDRVGTLVTVKDLVALVCAHLEEQGDDLRVSP